MTAPRDLDRLITDWLREEGASGTVTYHDETLRMLEGTPQRRRFRWLRPAVPRPPIRRFVPISDTLPIPLLLLLGALIATALLVVVVGSQPRIRIPFESVLSGPMVYSRDGDIVLLERDGRTERSLTTGPLTDHSPVVSRDGRLIAFTRQEDDPTAPAGGRTRARAVWIMNADGTGAAALMTGGPLFAPQSYAFSPDGRRLAISVGQDGLHVADLATGAARQIAGPGVERTDLAWSPDASLLAFEGNTDLGGDRVDTRVWVIGVDGTGETPVSEQLDYEPFMGFGLGVPEWAPSGETLLYSLPDGPDGLNRDIVVARRGPDGWRETRLFPASSDAEMAPAYSNSGSELAFVRVAAGGGSYHGLWIATSEGAGARRIADLVVLGESLCWSPDDRQIGVLVQTHPSGGEPRTRIFDVAGSGSRSTCRRPSRDPVRARSGRDRQGPAAWQPRDRRQPRVDVGQRSRRRDHDRIRRGNGRGAQHAGRTGVSLRIECRLLVLRSIEQRTLARL